MRPLAPGTDAAASSLSGIDVCATAIAELVRLILELTSTNAAINFENSTRLREELEHALGEAKLTFEALPEGPPRGEAMRRLEGLRALAERQLSIAPVPSTGAIAAAEAGDSSLWFAEADEWAAERLAHGSSRLPQPRRSRSDTRPDSPGALRDEPLNGDQLAGVREPFLVIKSGRP